jgi:hypothetical protein
MFPCDQRSRSEQVAVRSVLTERFSNPEGVMAKEKELKDLFLDTLKDIYFAEKKNSVGLAKNGQGRAVPEAQSSL